MAMIHFNVLTIRAKNTVESTIKSKKYDVFYFARHSRMLDLFMCLGDAIAAVSNAD